MELAAYTSDQDRSFNKGYQMGRVEGYDELEEEYQKHPLSLLLGGVDYSIAELSDVLAVLPAGNRLAAQLRNLLEAR